MRHIRLFEAQETNFRLEPKPKRGVNQDIPEAVKDEIVAMLKGIGLKPSPSGSLGRQEDCMDMELGEDSSDCDKPSINMYQHFIYDREHYLYVSVASLDDDYWQLSFVAIGETHPDDEFDILVDMYLICDDLGGLEMAIKGPLAELARRMAEIEAKYKALSAECGRLGDGLQTRG